jgi:hypothetical protein
MDRDVDREGHEGGPVGIFPTFFMAGFECSTFIWKDRQRKDYVALTGHDRFFEQDYDCVEDLGCAVVREAARWPLIDRGKDYDWSSFDPFAKALTAREMTAIWDLCHYGFPDECSPLDDDCLRRFTDYARAVAKRVKELCKPPFFFTPINEITFLSGAATDMGWMYPFAKGRYDDMKRALCKMSIEGAKAIREVIPDARMVHVDPLIYEVPEEGGDQELAREAHENTYVKAFEAWDILAGKKNPELGGAPDILDIVGVNVYHYSQAQLKADKSRQALGPRDPRRKPLSEMLMTAWERYRRPVIIGETSGYQDRRDEWLRMVMEESLKALNDGIDLQGVCLYPAVDIPDWLSGKMAQIGIYDLRDLDQCERVEHAPYIRELRNWQHRLEHLDNIEPETLAEKGVETVRMEEIRTAARAWGEQQKQQPRKVANAGRTR